MSSKHYIQKRPAAVLAIVLVTLIVVLLLGGAMTQAILVHHHQSRRAEQLQQAEWLAAGAVERAREVLTQSPDYQGDNWVLAAGTLNVGQPSVVKIEVKTISESPNRRLIRVEIPAGVNAAKPLYITERLVEIARPGGTS